MGHIAEEQELGDYAIDYVVHMTDCLVVVAAKYQDVQINISMSPSPALLITSIVWRQSVRQLITSSPVTMCNVMCVCQV